MAAAKNPRTKKTNVKKGLFGRPGWRLGYNKFSLLVFFVAFAFIGGSYAVYQSHALAYCYSGEICFYDYYGSGSDMWAQKAYATSNFHCQQMGQGLFGSGSMNNRTSYIKNVTNYDWTVFLGNCGSTWGHIYPNSSGSMNSTYNNGISAYWRGFAG